jgi:hypothetical protein
VSGRISPTTPAPRVPLAALTTVLLAALAAPPALADASRRASGCSVERTAVDAEGVGTFVSECHWAVSHALVRCIFTNRELLDSTNPSLSSRALPDGRVLNVHSIGFPIADRQVTIESVYEELPDGGLRSRYWRSARQEPLERGRVQVRIDEGVWEILPDGSGGTLLRYEMRYDPGGSLEPWLVRRLQAPGIERSLVEIRDAAKALAAGEAAAPSGAPSE